MSRIGYFVILIFATFPITNASHFRGAIFSWTPSEDGSTIKIKFRISWRRTYTGYWCNDTVISASSLIGSGSMTCYSGCTGTVGSLQYHCTDYSASDDWSSGMNDVIYSVSAKSFSFRFTGSAWIDTLKVGAGGSWSVLATVDLSVRSDTGRINSSPTVEMTPVLNLQDGCPYKIFLQVGDVDGDIVKCRWAKGDIECDDICNGFPGAILDEKACSITYNPYGNQGLYAAALQIEDFASTVSTTPFSSVPLQFIVKVHSGRRCDDIPEFIQPTPDDSSCFALDVGDKINVTVKARGTKIFNRITTISAVGMVRSSEKKWQDSTWHYIETNVTWTPTENDAGQDHTLCFYATDATGVTSQTRCIKLPVSVSGPTPLRVERIGFTNTWTIIIDQTFARPKEAAYIKVYESLTNTELISVDASTSSDVVFDPINRQINVSFHYDFDIEEDYHVTIPSGLVEGFVSCGALSVAVNDSGFWNIEVDCGNLNILNGVVIAPNGTDYPHSVFYVCNIGHDLVGVKKRTCTANGTWTEHEPFCKIRDCGNFSIPDNGFVSTSSTIYNTTVDFYCDEGFEMSGNSSMYCEHTALWNTSPPVCILVDCRNPGYLDNGDVSTPNGTTFGMTTYYSCHQGYDLIGVSDRKCQQDKQWSGTRPFCSPKDCGSLLPPVDGIMDIDNTTVGNTVTYTCDVGYILQGDRLRECLHTALWSGSDPTCELADCGQLQSPLNGNVFANGSIYKSVGIFSCDQGYNLNGTDISVCQSNGSWSSLGHSCTIVDCGVLPPLIGGLYTYNTTTYGGTLTAECNDGHDLYGSNVRQCLETGDWNGTTTTCVIKDCGPLTNPANGSVSVAATVYGSVATYSCKSGFDMIGGSSITCQTNGSWSGKPPSCEIKDCRPLPSLANGFVYQPLTTYGSYALYLCDEGYHIDGITNIRRCKSDGNWSNNEPICAFTDCGNLTAPMFGDVIYNSTFYNDVAIFKCNTGYELLGDSVVTCQSDNTWSNYDHICMLKDCGDPIAPVNGEVHTDETVYRAKAEYVCHTGFELVGSKTVTCGEDELWSETGQYCTLKDCGIPPPPLNGNISYESTTFGSVARYICFTGYEIKGEELVSCSADGFWNSTAQDCVVKGSSAVTTFGIIGGVSGLMASGGIVLAVFKYWKKITL